MFNPQVKSRNEDILSLESDLASHKDTITTKELALNKIQIDTESCVMRLESALNDKNRDIEILMKKVIFILRNRLGG